MRLGPDQGLSFAHRAWGELARHGTRHESDRKRSG
jgi:hypothetical protein